MRDRKTHGVPYSSGYIFFFSYVLGDEIINMREGDRD